MIKIIDNEKTIEISKATRGSSLNVDVLDDNGDLEYYYEIKETELLELLKRFESENNIS